jgi:transposase-like protein
VHRVLGGSVGCYDNAAIPPGTGPANGDSAEMRELKKRNRLLEQENEILRRAAAYLARDINPK